MVHEVAVPAMIGVYQGGKAIERFFQDLQADLEESRVAEPDGTIGASRGEASMIATQLLLCQGELAMPVPQQNSLPVMCSPRGVLLEVRRDLAGRKQSLPFSEWITRGILFWTGNQRAAWKHGSRCVSMGRLLCCSERIQAELVWRIPV
jgi:hypothetical protein